MKKVICGLVFMASTFGTYAIVQCPANLSQDQMKALADTGNVTIDGVLYTTKDQQLIKDSLPSGKNIITKALGKSAERDYQQMNNDYTVKECSYNFRTYLQKFAKEDYVKFSISPPQMPENQPTQPQPPQMPKTSSPQFQPPKVASSVIPQPSKQVIPTLPLPSQNPQSANPQQPMRMPQSNMEFPMGTPQPPQRTAQGMPTPSRPVIPQYGQNPQSANPQQPTRMPQANMEFPMGTPHTPRPTMQDVPSRRALPITPQATGQNPSVSTAQELEKTGTFTFHRDGEGKVITSTFARTAVGKKGESYTESLVKDILYIKGTDGKDYLWYDPKQNNQLDNSNMMKAYKVASVATSERSIKGKTVKIDGLEGKSVKFKPTGRMLRIEGKEYELVTAIPTPLGG